MVDHTGRVAEFSCEFVGQPLLVGKTFIYSSYSTNHQSYSAKVTSTEWYSQEPLDIHAAYGWVSAATDLDLNPWIAVELDQEFIVKMAVFMPMPNDCCRKYRTDLAIVRVGNAPGLNQPVCGHLDSQFVNNKFNYIHCTSLIKGTFVTLQMHKVHPKRNVHVSKFAAFGIPV